MRVIFMCLGIAKVHQEPVTKELGDMSIKASDDFLTDPLIRPDHVPILFRIESAGEGGGVHQVTKHHGELAAFGVEGTRDP